MMMKCEYCCVFGLLRVFWVRKAALQVGVAETHQTLFGEQGIETFTYNFLYTHPHNNQSPQSLIIFMFQQIHLNKYHHSQTQISQTCITSKGVVAIFTQDNNIILFHHANPSYFINVEQQLRENFNLDIDVKKCRQITSIHLPEQDKHDCILVQLDGTLCIIWLKFIEKQQNHSKLNPRIEDVKLLPILSQQQKANKKRELSLIGVQSNKVVFCLHLPQHSFQIFSYSIQTNENINVSKQVHLLLNLQENQNQLNEMLYNYQLKLFNHFVFVYQVFGRKQQSHRCFYVNILNNVGQIQIIYLPQNEQYSILKDIYIVPLHKSIELSTTLLLYQIKGYVSIVQINLNDPTVPLKTVKHNIILHQIISSSMTLQALEFKGEQYCTDTLNLLVFGSDCLISEDKLLIIAAPFAHKPVSIINELSFPFPISGVVSNGKSNYMTTKEDIYQISLTSKAHIYSTLVKRLSDSDALARIIQQILD